MDLVEVLSFLFMLSTMELGRVRIWDFLFRDFRIDRRLSLGIFDRELKRHATSDARGLARLRPHLATQSIAPAALDFPKC